MLLPNGEGLHEVLLYCRKHVDVECKMEIDKFSGNLLKQKRGFGRIEPGLRYSNASYY